MACFDALSSDQVAKAISQCLARRAPVTVTVRRKNRWLIYRSRIIAEFGEFLWIAYPTIDAAADAAAVAAEVGSDFPAREQLGLTFRVSHRRHVFPVLTVGQETYSA